jgi:prepilin signal peptidase PulO-like enzyme (type II secretory pathway)
VGSFLNCIIYRLEKNESFLKGRSYCPHCKHILSWQDLIPILSFLILKGKCRYCHQKISLQYPLVELSTAILFVLIFNTAAFNLRTIYSLIICCFLIVIFVYDLKHYLIPDKVIYPAIGIAFLYQFFRSLEFENWNLFGIWNLEFGILKPLLSAFLASTFFLAIVLLSKGKWMGGGDIKVAFFMGLFLGFPKILVALFFAYLIGAIIGIGLILAKKKTLKSEVPFGPFLIVGTFISLFWGNILIDWYWSLFLYK